VVIDNITDFIPTLVIHAITRSKECSNSSHIYVHCTFLNGNGLVAGSVNDVGCSTLTWGTFFCISL